MTDPSCKSPTTSLMNVDVAQALQDGLNNAEAIDAAETKRLEEAKKFAPVSIRKQPKYTKRDASPGPSLKYTQHAPVDPRQPALHYYCQQQ